MKRAYARFLILAALIGLATAAVGQDQDEVPPDYSGTYYCKSFASGGLRFDKQSQQWLSTTFDVANDAHTIKLVATGKTGEGAVGMKYRAYQIGVKQFGSKDEPSRCFGSNSGFGNDPTDALAYGSVLTCRSLTTLYTIDPALNRLQIYFDGGFMRDTQDSPNKDTPYIVVAKCEKID